MYQSFDNERLATNVDRNPLCHPGNFIIEFPIHPLLVKKYRASYVNERHSSDRSPYCMDPKTLNVPRLVTWFQTEGRLSASIRDKLSSTLFDEDYTWPDPLTDCVYRALDVSRIKSWCRQSGEPMLPTEVFLNINFKYELYKRTRQEIMHAVYSGNLIYLKQRYLSSLLSIEPKFADLTRLANIANGRGETPLITASMRGKISAVEFLVETLKVDVRKSGNIYVSNDQYIPPIVGTALHAAVVGNSVDVVEYLAEVGESSIINAKTNDGLTALRLAIIHTTGEIQHYIVHCLLAHGADINDIETVNS